MENIIISNTVLWYNLLPQPRKITGCYKIICGCECCLFSTGIKL